MKIIKEEFDSLFSDDISKKKFDDIIRRIGDRVDSVWRNILRLQGRKLDWYDYNNESGRDNNGDPINGHFDPERYKENIEFTGEWSGSDYDMPYNDYIPVEFLWEDYEEKVISDIEKFKRDKEQKRIDNHNKREEHKKLRKVMIESIRSKLTKEELRFVRFAKQ